MKMFHLPINDERIATLTEEQIDLMLWEEVMDDPELMRKLENYYYDPEFDEELNKTSNEGTNQNSFSNNFSNKYTHNSSSTINNEGIVDSTNIAPNTMENDMDDEDMVDLTGNDSFFDQANMNDWEEVE